MFATRASVGIHSHLLAITRQGGCGGGGGGLSANAPAFRFSGYVQGGRWFPSRLEDAFDDLERVTQGQEVLEHHVFPYPSKCPHPEVDCPLRLGRGMKLLTLGSLARTTPVTEEEHTLNTAVCVGPACSISACGARGHCAHLHGFRGCSAHLWVVCATRWPHCGPWFVPPQFCRGFLPCPPQSSTIPYLPPPPLPSSLCVTL